MRLVFARRALRDIDERLAYIRSHSEPGARNVSIAIEHAIGLCAANPYIGAKTDEPDLLRYPLSRFRYTIFYRVIEGRDILEVVRVIHAARVQDPGKLPDDR